MRRFLLPAIAYLALIGCAAGFSVAGWHYFVRLGPN